MAKRTNTEHSNPENYEDILGMTANDVREPALYPDGPWHIRNVGASTSDTEDKEGNPQLLVNMRYVGFEPGDAVDPELLTGEYEGRTLWVKRYISKPRERAARDGTLARFVKFVELHGVDTEELDVAGMLKALKDSDGVMADIGHRQWEDKQTGETRKDNTVTNIAALS